MRRCRGLVAVALVLLFTFSSVSSVSAQGGGVVLLVATEKIRSSLFQQSVILVTRHGARGGAIGLMLNRPTNHRLSELSHPEPLPESSRRVFLGGPVDTDRLVFLVQTERGFERALELMPNLYMSENTAMLAEFLTDSSNMQELRIFRGFSGWAPGQLEREIQRGDWDVLSVDRALLFSDPETLWQRITGPGDDDRLVETGTGAAGAG